MISDKTQNDILMLITELRRTTAAELAQRLNLTPAAVRYHLVRLHAVGKIETYCDTAGQKQPGHPAKVYRLSPPNGDDPVLILCRALLCNRDLNNYLFWREIAANLVPACPDPYTGPARRLGYAIEQLNAMNYNAAWEAGPRGPRIRLRRCPYSALVPDLPQICRLDQALLERLCAGTALQTQKTGQELHSPVSCVFNLTLQSS
jgi:predicted ArsR family transcriptional regulator